MIKAFAWSGREGRGGEEGREGKIQQNTKYSKVGVSTYLHILGFTLVGIGDNPSGQMDGNALTDALNWLDCLMIAGLLTSSTATTVKSTCWAHRRRLVLTD